MTALAVAAYTAMLAGGRSDARSYLAQVHQVQPGYTVEDLLGAFQFGPKDQALFRGTASSLGEA